MDDAWITNLEFFEKIEEGLKKIEPEDHKRMMHSCSIVESLTKPPRTTPRVTDVKCRRQTNRAPCPGYIIATFNGDDFPIDWYCPKCGEHGEIYGWKGTKWDLSGKISHLRYLKGGEG